MTSFLTTGNPSHNNKLEKVRKMFHLFVENSRTTNGKTKALVRYYLHPHYKTIRIDQKNHHTNPYSSFAFTFRKLVKAAYKKGTKVTVD